MTNWTVTIQWRRSGRVSPWRPGESATETLVVGAQDSDDALAKALDRSVHKRPEYEIVGISTKRAQASCPPGDRSTYLATPDGRRIY